MKVINIPFDKKIPFTVHEISDRIDDSIEASGRVLEDIKELIGIEWSEIVFLVTLKNKDPHRYYCLIVDEIGKCKDGWTDRINIRASTFYPGSFQGDPIVGDVVLCARQWTDDYGECDFAGLTDHEVGVLSFILDAEVKDES